MDYIKCKFPNTGAKLNHIILDYTTYHCITPGIRIPSQQLDCKNVQVYIRSDAVTFGDRNQRPMLVHYTALKIGKPIQRFKYIKPLNIDIQ